MPFDCTTLLIFTVSTDGEVSAMPGVTFSPEDLDMLAEAVAALRYVVLDHLKAA